ncbi:MAG: sirohydrochlorin chelatase [Alphaproteobacteria bacterium]
MSETMVMVCGHGSRDTRAIREFEALATGLAQRLPDYTVTHGFLEFARPIIREGLDALREAGAKRILAVPGMLFAAAHAKNDIPSVLNRYDAEHPGVSVDYGRELAVDLKLLRAARDRIEAAEARANATGAPIDRADTCLVVVGRGASDPDANSNVAKVMRMLWEGMGFGWAEVCYSGVTFPLTDRAFDRVTRLGFGRVIVFPYFLFTGVLVKRIYRHADEAAARHRHVEFVKAGYLNDHPLVFDTFIDRLNEILDGGNLMNCQLCKYREQMIGFEDEVGAPQMSHHHHVEGIGTDDDHHHHHGHHHDHERGHAHAAKSDPGTAAAD